MELARAARSAEVSVGDEVGTATSAMLHALPIGGRVLGKLGGREKLLDQQVALVAVALDARGKHVGDRVGSALFERDIMVDLPARQSMVPPSDEVATVETLGLLRVSAGLGLGPDGAHICWRPLVPMDGLVNYNLILAVTRQFIPHPRTTLGRLDTTNTHFLLFLSGDEKSKLQLVEIQMRTKKQALFFW